MKTAGALTSKYKERHPDGGWRSTDKIGKNSSSNSPAKGKSLGYRFASANPGMDAR